MVKFYDLSDGTRLAYDDQGSGRPVVLMHGVLASRRFYERNATALAEHHRVISLDFRGHGDSDVSQGGNTIPRFAEDLEELLEGLGLQNIVLVGWSMGNFVAWEYLDRFADRGRVSAHVCVSQGPSDLITAEWPHGFTDPAGLRDLIRSTQTDYRGVCAYVATIMTKDLPSDQDQAWMVEEQLKAQPNTAGLILADQTQRDYREVIPRLSVPTLAVWGSDEKCLPVAAGHWLRDNGRNVELVVFEDSGHMPMWEEPDRFNSLVGEWLSGTSVR